MYDYQSLVERKLAPKGVSGKDSIYACPLCESEDTGHHLYVDYSKGYWHCFHCDAGGKRIESLLKLLNISVDYDYEILYNEQDERLEDIFSLKSTKKSLDLVDYSTDLEILTEYFRLHTSSLSESAYLYLKSRGLDDSIIYSLGIKEGRSRYGEDIVIKNKSYIGRDYSGRIMIPSLRKDGLISFYVGRDYIGDKSPKYLNPPKELVASSEDVWSLDIIDTSTVIICEGVFTSIAVNQALGKLISCATYGKSIAQHSSNSDVLVTSQGEKLLNKKFSQYIIFYDKDAKSSAIASAKYLYERGATVRVVTIPEYMYGPKADAADMKREEVIQCIQNSIVYDRFSEII